MFNLDIGCGSKPKGIWNLDLYWQNVNNFIQGDSLKLPIKDNSLPIVYSSGLSFWQKKHKDEKILSVVAESIRVAQKKVIFEYNYNNVSSWNVRHPDYSFKMLNAYFENVKVCYSDRGKMKRTMKLIEKLIGRRRLISFLNRINRTYRVQFTIDLKRGKL